RQITPNLQCPRELAESALVDLNIAGRRLDTTVLKYPLTCSCACFLQLLFRVASTPNSDTDCATVLRHSIAVKAASASTALINPFLAARRVPKIYTWRSILFHRRITGLTTD